MKSQFSIRGHPLHPALVGLPIGLFVWTLVSDVIYLITDNIMWYDIAFYTGIAAIVTALAAALPGFGDFFTMPMSSRTRIIATAHMVGNLTLVTLFVIAAIIAFDHGALAGTERTIVVLLHVIGVGILGLTGFLGGQMVYFHRLAVVAEGEPGTEPVAERQRVRAQR